MKTNSYGSRPGTTAIKKRSRSKYVPYSEEKHFMQLESGFAFFKDDLIRVPARYGQFRYYLTQEGITAEVPDLATGSRLLNKRWDQWGNVRTKK